MNKEKKQLLISLAVFAIYTMLIGIANVLTAYGVRTDNLEFWESIAGILMGMIAIPVFCIVIPLVLARRWQLDYCFWPKGKSVWLGAIFIAIYVFVANQGSISRLLTSGISLADFSIHFIAVTMFHITYYPLFVVLILPVLRKNMRPLPALILTALLFSSYHFVQFNYFPAGLTPQIQVLLFSSFFLSLLLYLATENLILVALAHNVGGSLNLATNGALFNQIDELFYITLVILLAMFAYFILHEIRRKKTGYHPEWWLDSRFRGDDPEGSQ